MFINVQKYNLKKIDIEKLILKKIYIEKEFVLLLFDVECSSFVLINHPTLHLS
jgi:hypothetical protein